MKGNVVILMDLSQDTHVHMQHACGPRMNATWHVHGHWTQAAVRPLGVDSAGRIERTPTVEPNTALQIFTYYLQAAPKKDFK